MWWLWLIFLVGTLEVFMGTLKFFYIFYLFHFPCGFFLRLQKSLIHFLLERTTSWVISFRSNFILFFIFLNFSYPSNRLLYRYSFGLGFLRLCWGLFFLRNKGLDLFLIHLQFDLFCLFIIVVGRILRGRGMGPWMGFSWCLNVDFNSPGGDLTRKYLLEELLVQ